MGTLSAEEILKLQETIKYGIGRIEKARALAESGNFGDEFASTVKHSVSGGIEYPGFKDLFEWIYILNIKAAVGNTLDATYGQLKTTQVEMNGFSDIAKLPEESRQNAYNNLKKLLNQSSGAGAYTPA